MLYSQLFGRSSKTDGKKLPVRSHRLLVQAGYIRESTAGRYYFLPLGQKVQLKFMEIIRQEMDASGAQEVLAPVLHPLALWRETNRDQAAGFELTRVKDRRGAEFALGGTAEEMFVDLVRQFNLSHRDLPLNLYQFGLKFRDELRVRGGLLRVREFIMKDAYSFSSAEQFAKVYDLMRSTYLRIFERIGLPVCVIAADGGYIGGEYCHEFVADAEVGESDYFAAGDYLAHEDVAEFDKTPITEDGNEKLQPLKQVSAVRGPSMEDSRKLHEPHPLTRHIKNVAYKNEKGEIILACLRGDLMVNEVKLQKTTNSHQLTLLSDDEIKESLNSYPGFLSAVNLKPASNVKYRIVADDSLKNLKNAISGANVEHRDYLNINLGRDFKPDQVVDIALAQAGHRALNGEVLVAKKGIEVANIFQLGYHYSGKMKGAEYSDQNGRSQRYYMGCYGIGVGRTLAAVAEIFSDDKGLVWPKSLTPYEVYLTTLQIDHHQQAVQVQRQLEAEGISVLYDDRTVSAGEKLADADLLGFPLRLVLSNKTMQSNQIEIKPRSAVGESAVRLISLDDIVDTCRKLL